MIRAVLVGYSESRWQLFRQPQWMAEVRRNPQSATLPKRYFDIDEAAYRQVIDDWEPQGAGSSVETALEILGRFGASEVTRS